MKPAANEILDHYSLMYPSAWEQAGAMRRDKDRGAGAGIPDWPAWCFMPLSGWRSVVSHHIKNRHMSQMTPAEEASEAAILAALGAWRHTQGIYRFGKDLFDFLIERKITGNLPADIFRRLPEWCVYVEAPLIDDTAGGFFAYLDHGPEENAVMLRLVTVARNSIDPAFPIYLGDWPLMEALRKGIESEKRSAPILLEEGEPEKTAKIVAPLLTLLLCLCDGPRAISSWRQGDCPANPEPIETKNGWELPLPIRPKIWEIGHEHSSPQ
jgi:hypothetical protein